MTPLALRTNSITTADNAAVCADGSADPRIKSLLGSASWELRHGPSLLISQVRFRQGSPAAFLPLPAMISLDAEKAESSSSEILPRYSIHDVPSRGFKQSVVRILGWSILILSGGSAISQLWNDTTSTLQVMGKFNACFRAHMCIIALAPLG